MGVPNLLTRDTALLWLSQKGHPDDSPAWQQMLEQLTTEGLIAGTELTSKGWSVLRASLGLEGAS